MKIVRLKVNQRPAEEQDLFITTEFIKLDSALKLCSVAQTGGHAKILVADGEIRVNGEVCTERGKKLHNGDIIRYKNNIFVIRQK